MFHCFWCVLFCGENLHQLKCRLHFLFSFSGSFVWNWFDFSPLPSILWTRFLVDKCLLSQQCSTFFFLHRWWQWWRELGRNLCVFFCLVSTGSLIFPFFILHCHISRGHLPSLLICICCLSLHFHCCFLLTSFYGVDIVNDQMLAPDVGLYFSVRDFCLCFICVLWFPLLFFIDSLKLLLSCSVPTGSQRQCELYL